MSEYFGQDVPVYVAFFTAYLVSWVLGYSLGAKILMVKKAADAI